MKKIRKILALLMAVLMAVGAMTQSIWAVEAPIEEYQETYEFVAAESGNISPLSTEGILLSSSGNQSRTFNGYVRGDINFGALWNSQTQNLDTYAHVIHVDNTGGQTLGPLFAQITGYHTDAFYVSGDFSGEKLPLIEIGIIPPGGRASFVVGPHNGLSGEVLQAEVTVFGTDAFQTMGLRFTATRGLSVTTPAVTAVDFLTGDDGGGYGEIYVRTEGFPWFPLPDNGNTAAGHDLLFRGVPYEGSMAISYLLNGEPVILTDEYGEPIVRDDLQYVVHPDGVMEVTVLQHEGDIEIEFMFAVMPDPGADPAHVEFDAPLFMPFSNVQVNMGASPAAGGRVSLQGVGGGMGWWHGNTLMTPFCNTVHLVAHASAGWRFSHWTINGSHCVVNPNPICGTIPSIIFRPMGNVFVTAVFVQVQVITNPCWGNFNVNILQPPHRGVPSQGRIVTNYPVGSSRSNLPTQVGNVVGDRNFSSLITGVTTQTMFWFLAQQTDPDWVFSHWVITGPYRNRNEVIRSGVPELTFNANGPVTVSAVFVRRTPPPTPTPAPAPCFSVRYNVTGTVGGTLTARLTNNTNVPNGAGVRGGTTVIFTPNPPANHTTEWTRNGQPWHPANPNSPQQLVINQNEHITVRYVPIAQPVQQFVVLYAHGANGTLTATVPSGQRVDSGTQVTFTATPQPGYMVQWHIGGVPWNAGTTDESLVRSITVNADAAVVAVFVPIPVTNFNLNYSVTGSAGGGITGTHTQGQVAAGTSVTLTATPPTSGEYTVTWMRNGVPVQTGSTNNANMLNYTFTMTQNENIAVQFTPVAPATFNLTYGTRGTAGGSVSGTPASGAQLTAGTAINLTATPPSTTGTYNVRWFRDGVEVTGSAGSLTFTDTMPSNNRNIEVEFTPVLNTLTYSVRGAAGGGISGTPASGTLVSPGTAINLTATPPSTTGTYNVRWFRDGVEVTSSANSLTFTDTMPSNNRNIEVEFLPVLYDLTYSTIGGGSVSGTPNQGQVSPGTAISLTATPPTGVFDVIWLRGGVEVQRGRSTDSSSLLYTDTMPSDDLDIVVQFVQLFSIDFYVRPPFGTPGHLRAYVGGQPISSGVWLNLSRSHWLPLRGGVLRGMAPAVHGIRPRVWSAILSLQGTRKSPLSLRRAEGFIQPVSSLARQHPEQPQAIWLLMLYTTI